MAEKVESIGEEVERETERWQSTRLIKSKAQPSGGEAIVTILRRIAWPAGNEFLSAD